MSFTEKAVPTIESLLSYEKKQLDNATVRHALVSQLLAALPAETPVPKAVNNFGYCAQASLAFEAAGLLQKLLKLYPAVPLVDVRGSTQAQKPKHCLRDQELRESILDIYPVVAKHEGSVRNGTTSARWWTTLAGLDVEVIAKLGDAAEMVIDSAKFEARSHQYSTGSSQFFVRKVEVIGGSEDALELWDQEWANYASRNGFYMARNSFVNALCSLVRDNPEQPVTRADLPEPHYIVGGQAVRISEGEDMVGTLVALTTKQANRTTHRWDRIGDFGAAFDSAQVEELLAFARAQGQAYPVAVKSSEAQSEKVAAWLTRFFSSHGSVGDHMTDITRRVEQVCRRETGLEVHLGLNGRKHHVSVSYRIGSRRVGSRNLSLPCQAELPPLKPQDIEVTYA